MIISFVRLRTLSAAYNRLKLPNFAFLALTSTLFSLPLFAQAETTIVRTVDVTLRSATSTVADKTPQDDAKPASTVSQSFELMTSPGPSVAAAHVRSAAPGTLKPAARRRLSYSEDQLVIVGLDADSNERTRSTMIDPRLVRAEALLGEKDLVSTRFYRPAVDFSVPIDDPEVVAIRILKPKWTGSDWLFDTIAEVRIQ